MEKINVGVVGLGNIGCVHAKHIADGKIRGLALTSICDINEEKLKILKKEYPSCSFFTSYTEMIDNSGVDAVIVATPHRFHSEIASYSLMKGKHVMIEKPIDVSSASARKLNEIAEKSDRVFSVMFNQRTNNLFLKAREIVKNGLLGELNRSVWIITNWFRTQKYYDSGDWRATWAGEGGGVLLNQAPHQLDLWQWICGMPVSVRAFCEVGKYHNIEVEDEAIIFTEYKNGATGVFITSTGEFPGTNRLEITGSLGKIIIENGVLKWWKLKKDVFDVLSNSNEEYPDIEFLYEEIKDNTETEGHIILLQNFSDTILKNEPLISPGIDAINEIILSNAAYLSAWKKNEKISLPFSENEFEKLFKEKTKNSSFKNENSALEQSHEYKGRWQVKW